jgi:hypothetical protein
MRIELNSENDFRHTGFTLGTTCAVCGKPIDSPPAVWRAENSMDFFLHHSCETGFGPEVVRRHLGDLVLAIQDRELHDVPPERN